MGFWWRGLPARAGSTSFRRDARTAGRMPTAPWAEMVAWAPSPRRDHQLSERRSHGGQDAHRTMGRNGGVGFQPAQGPSAFGETVARQAGCPPHHGKRWWRGLPARAGTTSLRRDGRTAGRMPTAPWEEMVAWASSPRMDHQPSEGRSHGGQDAHRTMGSIVRGPADTRHYHGRSGDSTLRIPSAIHHCWGTRWSSVRS
jgi:hypothetical protein